MTPQCFPIGTRSQPLKTMACLSQDKADQQDNSGVHDTEQCAEALMQESRVAEAGTQGLGAKLASAAVKWKSEPEQLAKN